MDYFRNDEETSQVAGMSIENGFGRISIHGSVEIRPDSASLADLDALVARLSLIRTFISKATASGEVFPDEPKTELTTVDNPFA